MHRGHPHRLGALPGTYLPGGYSPGGTLNAPGGGGATPGTLPGGSGLPPLETPPFWPPWVPPPTPDPGMTPGPSPAPGGGPYGPTPPLAPPPGGGSYFDDPGQPTTPTGPDDAGVPSALAKAIAENVVKAVVVGTVVIGGAIALGYYLGQRRRAGGGRR